MQRMELGYATLMSQKRRTLNVRNLSNVHLITKPYFLVALPMRVNMISPRLVVVACEAWRYLIRMRSIGILLWECEVKGVTL
jgi:hypothetical protein